MGFTVKLGVCTDPVNKIKKKMANTIDINCTVKDTEGINIMNPTLIFSDVNVIDYNYCYIPNFKRYYYVKSVNFTRNNYIELELTEDVLMSFKPDILNSECMLARSTTYRNYFIKDSRLPVTNKTLTWTREFPNSPFDGGTHGALVTIIGPNV